MLFSHPTQHIFRVPLCWGPLPGYIGFRATVFGTSSLGNLESCNISHQLGVPSKRYRGYTGAIQGSLVYMHIYIHTYIAELCIFSYTDV